MSQHLSAALDGFVAPTERPKKRVDTPHHQFIHSYLLPQTIKIKKELRGRRFKVGSSNLIIDRHYVFLRLLRKPNYLVTSAKGRSIQAG
jgi:hypothetical protein